MIARKEKLSKISPNGGSVVEYDQSYHAETFMKN